MAIGGNSMKVLTISRMSVTTVTSPSAARMPPAPPGVAADRIPLRARSIINGIRSIGAIGPGRTIVKAP